MTSEQRDLQAAIDSGAVQAWANGKQIQYEYRSGRWEDYKGKTPNFFCACRWRVKPEPEPEPPAEEWLVKEEGGGVLHRFNTESEAKAFLLKLRNGQYRIVHMREVLP
jgi:hypothetical protein